MFFTSLLPVLAGCKALTVMIVPGEGDKLTVTLIPKPKTEGEDASALTTPLALTGTTAELDEKFAEIVGKFAQARTDLEEQLETTTAVLDAAKRSSSDKASGALKKAAAGKPGAAKTAPATGGGDNDDDDDDAGGESPAGPAGATTPAAAPAVAEEPNLFA